MNELLGWYGYCNSENDHTTERFNNSRSAKVSTPNFVTTVAGHCNNSLSLDAIDNTTDSMSAVDDITKMSPQISKEANTVNLEKSSPPAAHSG